MRVVCLDLIGSLRLHQADSAFLANSAVTRAETQHKPPGTYMDDFVFVLSVYFLLSRAGLNTK